MPIVSVRSCFSDYSQAELEKQFRPNWGCGATCIAGVEGLGAIARWCVSQNNMPHAPLPIFSIAGRGRTVRPSSSINSVERRIFSDPLIVFESVFGCPYAELAKMPIRHAPLLCFWSKKIYTACSKAEKHHLRRAEITAASLTARNAASTETLQSRKSPSVDGSRCVGQKRCSVRMTRSRSSSMTSKRREI